MRLGQLARKLAISPTEIIEFLISKEIQVGDGSNTRLAEDHVKLVLQQFGSDVGDLTTVTEINKETVEEIAHPAVEEASGANDLNTVVDSNDTVEEPGTEGVAGEAEANQTVIRAPKLELPGLKVVGKIDLPEPKKKEPELPAAEQPANGEGAALEQENLQERKNGSRERKNGNFHQKKKNRPRKNPVAAQREREIREAEKRKQLEAEREKERRRQNYLKKVGTKQSMPTRPARIIDEPLETVSKNELAAPGTLWGKFLKWLWRS